MDIQAEKLELIKLLLETQKESVLEKIRLIFNAENQNYKLSPQQVWAVEDAISSLENIGGISHEKVMDETMKKYPKYFDKTN